MNNSLFSPDRFSNDFKTIEEHLLFLKRNNDEIRDVMDYYYGKNFGIHTQNTTFANEKNHKAYTVKNIVTTYFSQKEVEIFHHVIHHNAVISAEEEKLISKFIRLVATDILNLANYVVMSDQIDDIPTKFSMNSEAIGRLKIVFQDFSYLLDEYDRYNAHKGPRPNMSSFKNLKSYKDNELIKIFLSQADKYDSLEKAQDTTPYKPSPQSTSRKIDRVSYQAAMNSLRDSNLN